VVVVAVDIPPAVGPGETVVVEVELLILLQEEVATTQVVPVVVEL